MRIAAASSLRSDVASLGHALRHTALRSGEAFPGINMREI